MTAFYERLILNRLAFGASQDDLRLIREFGPDQWIEQQLNAPLGDDPATQHRLDTARLRIKYNAGDGYESKDEQRPLLSLNQDAADLWPLTDYKRQMAGQERQRPRQEVATATVIRAINSRWQIREVMVDFWHNHFNVNAAGDNAVSVALPPYDRVMRTHALGNFREFLEAVATSPAMLIYLNNRSSRAGNANENYGRELFELHTLGRNSYLNDLYNRWRDVPGALKGAPKGYIDQDVYEAARAFTGWTIEDGAGLGGGQTLPNTGRFAYVEGWHDNYQKRVLASDFDPFQAPMTDGRKVLDLVAFHPSTARFICTKLCRRLVSDQPSEALIAAAVQIWTENQKHPEQIKRVISVIAHSQDLREGIGNKVKRPLELIASYVRGAGFDITVTDGLLNELDNSGQRLFGWGPPTGHPDTMEYWLSSHIFRRRWILTAGLSDNWWGTGVFSPSARLGKPMNAGQTIALWHEHLTGTEADDSTLAAILTGMQLDKEAPLASGPSMDPVHRRILAYCAMTPAFNYR